MRLANSLTWMPKLNKSFCIKLVPFTLKDLSLALINGYGLMAIDEEFWPAINNIGLLEYQLGNLDAAIPQFEASIALDDTAAEPVLALATALYVQGETERATELGIQAIQLDFTYGDIQTLRDNLWGEELIRDVQVLLEENEVRDALNQARADSQLQQLNGTF